MNKLPQEIEVWYIIPAVRRELAIALTKKHELSYDKTAKILGITKPAVAQYLNNKRATKIKLPSNVLKEIDKSAKVLIEDKDKTVKEIMRILAFMRNNKISFEICSDGFASAQECKEIKVAYENYWCD